MGNHAKQPTASRNPTGRVVRSVLHWILQLGISTIGIIGLFDDTLTALIIWCVLATIYALVCIFVLGIIARGKPRPADALAAFPPWVNPIRAVMTAILTAVPLLIGVSSAVLVAVFGRGDPKGILAAMSEAKITESQFTKFLGVWAMLLAWGMLHWGYAQVYQRYTESAHADSPVFDFPSTPHPSIVDHVYFSYTLGTTFAASDVNVLSTRVRWTVTCHSVLGFLMNALIVVLSFNTIIGGSS